MRDVLERESTISQTRGQDYGPQGFTINSVWRMIGDCAVSLNCTKLNTGIGARRGTWSGTQH